jgi:hypothetical protein
MKYHKSLVVDFAGRRVDDVRIKRGRLFWKSTCKHAGRT